MVEEIKDKGTLENKIRDLKESNEFIINIPNFYSFDILNLFEEHNFDYSRTGFKKWYVKPKHKSLEGVNKIIIALRLVCLLSTFGFLFIIIFEILSTFWLHLEAYFINLPIATALITGLFLSIISTLSTRYIFKMKLNILLEKYLSG